MSQRGVGSLVSIVIGKSVAIVGMIWPYVGMKDATDPIVQAEIALLIIGREWNVS